MSDALSRSIPVVSLPEIFMVLPQFAPLCRPMGFSGRVVGAS
jgi:hypothetical protein